jgi:hypothetical protein
MPIHGLRQLHTQAGARTTRLPVKIHDLNRGPGPLGAVRLYGDHVLPQRRG